MRLFFISAIMLYTLIVAIYLLWERRLKRKKNAARKKGYNPFKVLPKEDIVGKSHFTLRHSKPQAATLILSDKREENTNIFADGNDKTDDRNTPAVVPPSELDRVFSFAEAVDDFGEINIEIEDKPEDESEPGDADGGIDTEESEDTEGAAGVSLAQGLKFNELAAMLKTVESVETATQEEKEEAGRVITEIRKTDMFEQVVTGEPKKKVVVSALMEDYFTAFHRRKRETGEITDEPTVKAPKDFDARAFA